MDEVMQRRLIMLFCERCCDVTVTLCDDDRAFHWRIELPELASTKALFMRKGFCDEHWNVLNWDKRQFVSDTSKERTKRWRENKVRRHGDVTVTKCDVLDTDTEQIHKKTIAQNGHARFSPSDIESVYLQYPRKTAKAAALKAIKKSLENLDDENPVAALRARVIEFANSPAGHKGEFVPYPATWFNRKQYLDDPKEWER
jgi:hypothetical protein